jgi:hypothetical protein
VVTGVDLEVFLSDSSEHAASQAPDTASLRHLAYAGSAVVGVVCEVDELVFEHPEQGWRKAGPGDIAYEPARRRVSWRAVDQWRPVDSPSLADALDRHLATHNRERARHA